MIENFLKINCNPGESWQRGDGSKPVDVLVVSDLFIEVMDWKGYISRMPPPTFYGEFAPANAA